MSGTNVNVNLINSYIIYSYIVSQNLLCIYSTEISIYELECIRDVCPIQRYVVTYNLCAVLVGTCNSEIYLSLLPGDKLEWKE